MEYSIRSSFIYTPLYPLIDYNILESPREYGTRERRSYPVPPKKLNKYGSNKKRWSRAKN